MRSVHFRRFGIAVLGVLAASAPSASAAGPPPPRAVNGHPVTVVASGVLTPTAFAFDDTTGTMFIGAFGKEETGKGGGVLAKTPTGAATKIAGIPSRVAGVVFHDGTLYVSAVTARGGKILAFSGWNGTTFASSKTIFDARKTVGSVNGLAWGPDGRLYGGGGLVVDVDKKGKAKKSPFPHPYSVFSIKPDGTGFKVLGRGLRQPWQLTFTDSSPNPFVTDLSQDAGAIPPDAIAQVKPGDDYGFPNCFLGVGLACKGKHRDTPLITLPRHSSPQGIQAVGTTLYVALFGGIGKSGPEVVTIPARKGGKPTPVLTGFAAPVVSVGVANGMLYAGDLTGSVYAVAL